MKKLLTKIKKAKGLNMCLHIPHIQVIHMPNMTLSIPNELHKFVKKHNEIKWSEIARRAMWEQARKLQLMDKLVKNSKLTEKDVNELDHKIKKGLLKRYAK